MKYCLKYNQKTYQSPHIQDADELTIDFNRKDTTLLKFLDKYSDKRINMYVGDEMYEEKDLHFLSELCKKYSNLYIKFGLHKEDKLEEIIDLGFPFFFSDLVNSWDLFLGLVECGVSDIYIVEELGFDLQRVAEVAHNEEVQIRVFPNVAQSSWEWENDLKKFFIRPEDIDSYSAVVDTIEFWGDEEKQDIYFTIYNKDKKWFGKLKEIIYNFNSDLDSRYIIPRFAEKRMNCHKECIKGGRCRRCDRIKQLSETLKDSELIVRIDKEK